VIRRFRTSAFSRPIDCALLSRHQARQVTAAPTTIPQKNQTRSSSMSVFPVIFAPNRSAPAATSFLVEKYASARMAIPKVKPTAKDRTMLAWRWIQPRNSSSVTTPQEPAVCTVVYRSPVPVIRKRSTASPTTFPRSLSPSSTAPFRRPQVVASAASTARIFFLTTSAFARRSRIWRSRIPCSIRSLIPPTDVVICFRR